MNRRYKDLIFTDHALARAKERQVDLSAAWAVWRHPNSSAYAQTKGAWVKKRIWKNRIIEIVVKQNDRKEWVVISVWAKDRNRTATPWLWRFFKWLWYL